MVLVSVVVLELRMRLELVSVVVLGLRMKPVYSETDLLIGPQRLQDPAPQVHRYRQPLYDRLDWDDRMVRLPRMSRIYLDGAVG